jgi:hypothetical protein
MRTKTLGASVCLAALALAATACGGGSSGTAGDESGAASNSDVSSTTTEEATTTTAAAPKAALVTLVCDDQRSTVTVNYLDPDTGAHLGSNTLRLTYTQAAGSTSTVSGGWVGCDQLNAVPTTHLSPNLRYIALELGQASSGSSHVGWLDLATGQTHDASVSFEDANSFSTTKFTDRNPTWDPNNILYWTRQGANDGFYLDPAAAGAIPQVAPWHGCQPDQGGSALTNHSIVAHTCGIPVADGTWAAEPGGSSQLLMTNMEKEAAWLAEQDKAGAVCGTECLEFPKGYVSVALNWDGSGVAPVCNPMLWITSTDILCRTTFAAASATTWRTVDVSAVENAGATTAIYGPVIVPDSDRSKYNPVLSADKTQLRFLSALGTNLALYKVPMVGGGQPAKVTDLGNISAAQQTVLLAWTDARVPNS